jgi:chorismate mutase/prephenate dehydratase
VAHDDEAAAVASELAARLYDLKIIRRHIEDKKNNYSPVSWSSPRSRIPGRARTRTSIMFSPNDKPGALYDDILYPFKEAKINLTKIESSRRRRGPGSIYFSWTCRGTIQEENFRRVIEKVRKKCLYLTHLVPTRGMKEQRLNA